MPKTVLILGAGFAGLPLAHYILKNYVDKFDLKVILVSRSREFYWNIAAPRAVIPGQFKDDAVLLDIPTAFAGYPAQRFEFVLGTVDSWKPDEDAVVVKVSGDERSIQYSTIIVATGSEYLDSMPWKLGETEEQTHIALARMRSDIERAETIVVGGAGPTGVEFAGELGYEYAKIGKKKVTLVMADAHPFESRVMPATRMAAVKELEKLGVSLLTKTRITKVSKSERGGQTLELTKNDGSRSTLEAALFVPTWGVKYNTTFAPDALKEANGQLKVTSTLRSPGYDNVFLVGDAAKLDSYAAAVREVQVRHLAKALGKYFAGEEVPEYSTPEKVTITATVGRGRGVGQLGNINLWSLFVWYFKGRHMCTNIAADYVAGKTLILGSL